VVESPCFRPSAPKQHIARRNQPSRSSKKHKNRRVRPQYMIQRIDEKPKPINPSGWVSQDRMPIAQAGLLRSQSTRPRPPIIEQLPTNSTFSQSPEHIHSQPSGQQSNDSDAESGSELEDLSEVPRRGRYGREALSSLTPPACSHTSTESLVLAPFPTSWPLSHSHANRVICPFPTAERSASGETVHE
jgi:hypothetical protein